MITNTKMSTRRTVAVSASGQFIEGRDANEAIENTIAAGLTPVYFFGAFKVTESQIAGAKKKVGQVAKQAEASQPEPVQEPKQKEPVKLAAESSEATKPVRRRRTKKNITD